jgi:AbrB family looped-hinge helix DNA binding protein
MLKNLDDAIYGLGTVGEKGQIVIPAKAREKLNIAHGETFVFFGRGQIIHLVRAHELDSVLDKITQKLSRNFSKIRKDIKENIKQRIKEK